MPILELETKMIDYRPIILSAHLWFSHNARELIAKAYVFLQFDEKYRLKSTKMQRLSWYSEKRNI